MKNFIKIATILLVMVVSINAETLNLTGSVISDNQKMITSRYMGFVIAVGAEDGQRVKKGDLLYEIDSKEIDSAKAQVNLAISQAELASQMYSNQYQNLLLNLQRHRRLLQKDMVSKYDVENLELAEKNLKAMVAISQKQIKQARAKLQEVLNQYKYLRITAPNDGVVIAKNIKVGEMAMPGMPAFILSDLSNLKIVTEISESNLASIKVGQKVHYEIPSMNISTEGVIDSIIPSSNPMTHTFKLKVDIQKNSKNIYPGMYAIVKVN
jgi:RND family efflux transporter MFP subunit